MRWGKHVSGIKKAEILQRLGYLLQQGYSLSEGLELLQLSQKEPIKIKFSEVLKELKEGQALYKALESIKLPNDISSFIYFSEQIGGLPTGLVEAGKLYLKQEQIKEKIGKLLMYPLFLIWILFIVMTVMVTYLFPHFKSLFDTMSVDLPFVTVLFLHIIDSIPFLLLGGLVASLFGFTFYITKFRHFTPYKKMTLILKVPFVSSYVSALLTYYFCIQLSSLLKGGLSISQALNIFKEQSIILFLQDEAAWLIQRLKEGERLSDLLSQRPFFNDELAMVIEHGQKRGALDLELLHYSEHLFVSIEEKTKKVVMVLQPSMFVIIGVIVLLMFLSILVPMFQLINSLS
ncbi:competence type IV pilus assembly protein ComGB [Alkalihalobacterium chitinilyticum]|uniref:Competence type IV pilus assembly protein ComGB n=1 Tax=Alkalihalobacterium chitinilyticum TaxID=2980103 RepID=A0ABT5VF59_9BACI|nr:competence type IV pilus assembly protein ComGB [Alkalihalobacterium chitinilyticum]MDE5413972.1 competence type IV pilus assembly protein ComGB [Alkalihalobacterium chitinilyticum]